MHVISITLLVWRVFFWGGGGGILMYLYPSAQVRWFGIQRSNFKSGVNQQEFHGLQGLPEQIVI